MRRNIIRGAACGLALFIALGTSWPLTFTANAQEKAAQNQSLNAAPTVAFTNPAPITIPEIGPATPFPSVINVSGLSGVIAAAPGSLTVTLNGFSHDFPDDLGIVLVGPTGAAFEIYAGATNDTTGPAASNLTITISDAGTIPLPDNTGLSSTTYRPTSYYPGTTYAPPIGENYLAPAPAGDSTFASVFGGTNPNGDWKLYIEDFTDPGGTGTVSGGWTLNINSAAAAVVDAVVDFDGDHKTDFAVTRAATTADPLAWYINDGEGNFTSSIWGLGTDIEIPADYDGDGKDDLAIWRPAAASTFCALLSQTQTARCEQFGQTGDDPRVIGDYNNDNKDDIAVYRNAAAPGGQSFWFYRTTPGGGGGNFTSFPWGTMGDFPAPGDYDKDGRNDFVIQRNDGGRGLFAKYFAGSGLIEYEIFGNASDVIVTGDYDGDQKTDIAVVRGSGGRLLWLYEPSGTVGQTVRGGEWGLTTDLPVPGDYDGDSRTDLAVWRSGSPSVFYVLQSGNNTLRAFPWGNAGPADYPVANYNQH